MAFHHPRLDRQAWRCRRKGIPGGRNNVLSIHCSQRNPLLTSYPGCYMGSLSLLPGIGWHILPSSHWCGEACHLGSHRGVNQGGKEVLLTSRMWELYPKAKKGRIECSSCSKYEKIPLRERAGSGAHGWPTPSSFSRISELLALNFRT